MTWYIYYSHREVCEDWRHSTHPMRKGRRQVACTEPARRRTSRQVRRHTASEEGEGIAWHAPSEEEGENTAHTQ